MTHSDVYSMDPHPQWRLSNNRLASAVIALVYSMLIFLSVLGELNAYRLVHVGSWVFAFVFRVAYYWPRRWWFYGLDLCYVANHVLVCLFCFLTPRWMDVAVFMIAAGPVGGGALALRTPGVVHHAEGFASVFMHVGSVLSVYALRWRWHVISAVSTQSALHDGLLAYGVWAMFYYAFIFAKPYLPWDLSEWPTLVDYNVEQMFNLVDPDSGHVKPAPRGSWGVFAAAHAALSLQGCLIAAWALQDEAVCTVGWILKQRNNKKIIINPKY